jgi:hypothetical protein
MRFLAVLGLFAAGLLARDADGVNPVQKVVELLKKLQAEIEQEGKDEAITYDKYACFCKTYADKKQKAIEKFIKQEDILQSKIDARTSTKGSLDSEISDLNGEINNARAEQLEADYIRGNASLIYQSRDHNLTLAITRIKEAINTVKAKAGQMADAGGLPALLAHDKQMRNALVLARVLGEEVEQEEKPDWHALVKKKGVDPSGKAHASTFHAGEILATLKNILKKAKKDKYDADMEEQTDRHDYELTSNARKNQIMSLKHQADRKTSASGETEEEINAFTTMLIETQAAHTADQNFLNDLEDKCEEKASDWDTRSKTRTSELTAISKALALLAGDVTSSYGANNLGLAARAAKVRRAAAPAVEAQAADATEDADADVFDDDLEDDLNPVAFLQMERPQDRAVRRKALQLLSSRATQLKSKTLTTLLLKLRDAPTPFQKVKQMIEDLVARLEAEAQAEQDQKTWCDENMKNTQDERDAAQRAIEGYNALHMEKSTLADQLTEQMVELAKDIADLNKALNDETLLREKEKKGNEQVILDATTGKAAIEQAVNVLTAFYGTGFVQLKVKQEPVAPGYMRTAAAEGAGADGRTVQDIGGDPDLDPEYSGKHDAAASILGLFEVIKTDFETTITETNKLETDQQKKYDDFKKDTEDDIKDKSELKVTKEGQKTEALLDVSQAEADLRAEKEVLKNALDELEKLKPVCVESGMSWEERTARREQEIDSLKEALNILHETDFR